MLLENNVKISCPRLGVAERVGGNPVKVARDIACDVCTKNGHWRHAHTKKRGELFVDFNLISLKKA